VNKATDAQNKGFKAFGCNSKGIFSSRIPRICLLLLLLTSAIIAHSQEQSGPAVAQPVRLAIGFTSGIFSDVQRSDALAATQVWASEIKRKEGIPGPVVTSVFDDLRSLVEALQNKQVDMVILLTREFLEIASQGLLTPSFVPTRNGKRTERCLVLVHRLSGLATFDDLRGKDIIVLQSPISDPGQIWLETMVRERGAARLVDFFGGVELSTKPSQTILPVFFRHTDVCLTTDTGFETMAEMNPQLRNELVPVSVSPQAVPSLVCIRIDYDAALKALLVDALAKLHTEPRGQQILTVFKVDRMEPFKTEDLAGVGGLLQLLRRTGSR